jgi:hypothetical protein
LAGARESVRLSRPFPPRQSIGLSELPPTRAGFRCPAGGFPLKCRALYLGLPSVNGKEAAVSIELDHDSVKNMEAKPEFYSEAVTLVIDGKETKVKVQAVQRHPFKPKLAHIDFVRV